MECPKCGGVMNCVTEWEDIYTDDNNPGITEVVTEELHVCNICGYDQIRIVTEERERQGRIN